MMFNEPSSPSATLHGMKLQFSLATLLVCVTVLAVVAGLCASVKVRQDAVIVENHLGQTAIYDEASPEISQLPNETKFARRVSLWVPASVAATLGVLWTMGVRRERI
jgi:hypothetical protein